VSDPPTLEEKFGVFEKLNEYPHNRRHRSQRQFRGRVVEVESYFVAVR
jgi:hypothetical protein